MSRMIRADFSRIGVRIPRYILLLLIALVEVVVLFAFTVNVNSGDLFTLVLVQFLQIIPFMFGMIEMGFVYGDDLKAKAMQVGVGLGISRRNIVLAKWVETVLLLCFDFAFMILVACGISALRQIGIGVFLLAAIKVSVIKWIETTAFITIAVIFIYLLQSTGVATMVFILLSFGIVNVAVQVLSTIKQIQFLQLDTCTITYFMENSPGHPLHIIGTVLYILVALIISIFIYGNKELDF